MACERKGAVDVPSVFFTVPPYTVKGVNNATSQTIFKVLGAITVIAIVVAGAISVSYLFWDPSSSGGSRLDGSKEHLILEGHRKEFFLKFILEGKAHKELIQVDEDQNLVIISDLDADFSVTLDYDRGIAMIKNTSSSDCFFTRVEHIPEYQTNNIKTVRPIVVQETSSKAETITFVRSNAIPRGYVQLTSNPRTSKQCTDSASYWLEEKPPTRRQKRKMADDFVTWLEGIPPTRMIQMKLADDFVSWIPSTIQHPPEA